MKHQLKFVAWLKSSDGTLANWSTFAMLMVTLYAVFLAKSQLMQADEHKKWQNYNDLNSRYAELYKMMPADISSGCSGNFDKLKPKTIEWVRQYFNLYSEEYWLFLNNLIPREMWDIRIHNGVRTNLKKYPALVDGYRYWKVEGSFNHPADFHAVVELAILDASKLQIGRASCRERV